MSRWIIGACENAPPASLPRGVARSRTPLVPPQATSAPAVRSLRRTHRPALRVGPLSLSAGRELSHQERVDRAQRQAPIAGAHRPSGAATANAGGMAGVLANHRALAHLGLAARLFHSASVAALRFRWGELAFFVSLRPAAGEKCGRPVWPKTLATARNGFLPRQPVCAPGGLGQPACARRYRRDRGLAGTRGGAAAQPDFSTPREPRSRARQVTNLSFHPCLHTHGRRPTDCGHPR